MPLEAPKPQPVDPRRLKLTDTAGAQGVLLGRRCRRCGVHAFGPASFCPSCTSPDLEPVELGRRGTLYSYTIVRVPPVGWPGSVPYILGQVELPEGPHVLAEVVDCPESQLAIGAVMELALQTVKGDGEAVGKVVYKFRPLTPGVQGREARP